ncbi:exosome complex component CSL4 isoform X1 [Dermacentor albipictus]|uniref:exosome complex component CSL4 isoform X1 n=1 Tax=Dermacentor albipictus TaxID=60249 RepID=UPI0031FDEDC2
MSCLPFIGQRLCASGDRFLGGDGTYVQNGYIYSSLTGLIKILRQKDKKTLVEVQRCTRQNVPAPGNIVTVKITSVTHRFCKCSIIAIEDCELCEPFRGIIRKEDVREFEKDTVEMHKCFRTGDIVLARVISLGDALSYYLSTAENKLGVVVALGPLGVPMVPVSWTAMQCPVSSVKELRKVAKLAPAS